MTTSAVLVQVAREGGVPVGRGNGGPLYNTMVEEEVWFGDPL